MKFQRKTLWLTTTICSKLERKARKEGVRESQIGREALTVYLK